MRFLLVDRIEEVVPGTLVRGVKTVAMSEDYLEWHFPDRPILPGTLVVEAFAQLAGWHEAVASDFARWALVDRVTSARYFGFSGPGDRIELRLEVRPCADAARRTFHAEATVGTERRAVVELEAVVTSLPELEDPVRMRRLYDALRGVRPAPESRRGRP